jgi:hypothetical protein
MEATDSEQKIEEVIGVLGEEVARLRAQRADISTRIARMSQITLRLKHLHGSGTDAPCAGRGSRLIEGGEIRKCKKKPSKQFRDEFGHTPLSIEEDIPWKMPSARSRHGRAWKAACYERSEARS